MPEVIYGAVPMRRPNLLPLKEEHSLPVCPPNKRFIRHRRLGEYDVKLQSIDADDKKTNLPHRPAVQKQAKRAPADQKLRGCPSQHTPKPPARTRTQVVAVPPPLPFRGSISGAKDRPDSPQAGLVVMKSVQHLGTYPAVGDGGVSVASFPAAHKTGAQPGLLTQMQRYIAGELAELEKQTGRPLTPGDDTRYWVYRRAFDMFCSEMRSYEHVLSEIASEFDACARRSAEKSGAIRTLEAALREQEVVRAADVAEIEKKHRSDVASILKEVHKTKVANLLSTDLEALQDRVEVLTAKLETAEWGNDRLLEKLVQYETGPGAAPPRPGDPHPPEANAFPVAVTVKLVHALGGALKASLQTVAELKAKEEKTVRQLNALKDSLHGVKGLKDQLENAEVEKRIVEDELKQMEASYRTLETEFYAVKREAVEARYHAVPEEKKRLARLKEEVASQKKAFKQSLYQIHLQMAALERSHRDPDHAHLSSRPLLPPAYPLSFPPLQALSQTPLAAAVPFPPAFTANEGLGWRALAAEFDELWAAVAAAPEVTVASLAASMLEATQLRIEAKQKSTGDRLGSKCHSHLVNLAHYMQRFHQHADCGALLQVFRDEATPELWRHVRRVADDFWQRVSELAARPAPEDGQKPPSRAEGLCRIAADLFPTRTPDAAAKLVYALLPPPGRRALGAPRAAREGSEASAADSSKRLADADGPQPLLARRAEMVELVKAVALDEARLFVHQIQEAVRITRANRVERPLGPAPTGGLRVSEMADSIVSLDPGRDRSRLTHDLLQAHSLIQPPGDNKDRASNPNGRAPSSPIMPTRPAVYNPRGRVARLGSVKSVGPYSLKNEGDPDPFIKDDQLELFLRALPRVAVWKREAQGTTTGDAVAAVFLLGGASSQRGKDAARASVSSAGSSASTARQQGLPVPGTQLADASADVGSLASSCVGAGPPDGPPPEATAPAPPPDEQPALPPLDAVGGAASGARGPKLSE
ncbi:hypothetical protein DIPPA_19280 [Diplonema papillatum]|nr:hypothetical protein DIPPA_19280 [Diplonema papillatum]